MGATIESLVEKIKTLPMLNQMKISAMLGAVVADAATRPFHWLYNQDLLAKTVGDKHPEFWPKSMSQFYILPLGMTSNYNDVARVSLASLCENKGNIDIKHICGSFKKQFGSGTDYAVALSRRPTELSGLAMEGRWIQKAMIHFLEKYEAGISLMHVLVPNMVSTVFQLSGLRKLQT